MTCAHVVDVALKKVPGVASVDVSLNKGLATVKLKSGNAVSVPLFWQLLHEKGYTPKTTTVSARGDVTGAPGRLQLKISGTRDILNLAPDPKNTAAYDAAAKKIGQPLVIQGIMTPAKDLKVATPVQVTQVQ